MNIYKLNGVNVAIWNTFLLFAIALFIFSVFEPFAYGGESSDKVEKVQISEKTQFRFFRSNKKLSHKWKHIGYDDSSWFVDTTGLDQDRSDEKIQPYDKVYTRREFTVKNSALAPQMNLTVACNGPFIAYYNGIEVARSKKGTKERIDFSGFADELVQGNNVFAIELSKIEIGSTNILFIPGLEIKERVE
jgi:hypothetical protein